MRIPLTEEEYAFIKANAHLKSADIACQLGREKSTISKAKRKLCCPQRDRRTYRVNDEYFSKLDTPEKAYWLGFLYADGCLVDRGARGLPICHIKLSLAAEDAYVIEQFQKDVEATYPISSHQQTHFPGQQRTYEIILNSRQMYGDLVRLGCGPRKSLTLRFPTSEQVSDELMPHFIRGYFDGDGCISHVQRGKYPAVSVCGTIAFLESMRQWLAAHGIDVRTKLDKRHPGRPHIDAHSLRITSTPLIGAFFGLAYTGATRFLTRKRAKFESFFSERFALAI